MTNAEKEFLALLSTFATNSRVQLTQTMIRVYDLAIQPYGYELGARALEKLMMSTKTWQMPTPQQMIEAIENKPSRRSEADEVAGRIHYAISRYGYSNGSSGMEYIGPIGREVVKRFGGWSYLCEEMGMSLDPSSTRAQMRDAALSILDISDKRDLNEAPQLQSQPKNQIESTIKVLAAAKEMPK